jgi:hypothetical protein
VDENKDGDSGDSIEVGLHREGYDRFHPPPGRRVSVVAESTPPENAAATKTEPRDEVILHGDAAVLTAAATDATDATDGALVVDGGISVAKKIFCASTVTASNFITTSDRRLKSEIEPIKEGLEIIKQFSSYNYIKDGEKESGFIAQEVKEVIPHAVYQNNEGYLSMSDRGVVAYMHKAILELEKRLISIEEKLK